ncbi:uncharacterized protein [Atheta coriaria]|uniref:uncharacterized protein isoform X1 n=1 Tax=Dalotia coriaria TaxID=877792 RepID=UPI0031F3C848
MWQIISCYFFKLSFLSKIIIVGGLISMASTPTSGLKWVRVNLPQYRRPGELAQLQCDYDLGNDTLYAVKWYKENEEFYRFVLKERPQANSYKVEGVHVDISLSDSKKVVLRSVGLQTGGLYRCEVSAEAPFFASAQSEARLAVVSFPRNDPKITGVESQYQIGDEINLNCTSGKSYPASLLHWYINDQPISNSNTLIKYPAIEHRHGLVTTVLGMRFNLSSRHFLDGPMRIKCIASVSPLLWRDDRSSVVQNLPVHGMREALLLVRSNGNHVNCNLLIILIVLPSITYLQ